MQEAKRPRLRVLHYSTHDEECGVAKYQEQYVAAMQKIDPTVEHVFFELSPNKIRLMNNGELSRAILAFQEQLKGFDVLHIQHETGLYSDRELRMICNVAKRHGKRIVVTVHAAPLAYAKPIENLKSAVFSIRPRSVLGILKAEYGQKKWLKAHYYPLKKADVVLVHNKNTKAQLIGLGFGSDQVRVLEHPVQEVTNNGQSIELAKNLHKQKGDILYCTVGWLHKKKGITDAIKALSFLPENYKLAVIGGIQDAAANDRFLNNVCDLIDARGLKDRVYITGFIEDDTEMNNMIQACDICIYPYDKVYYAQVSSGAINLAIANRRSVVAYPVQTFVEMRDAGAPVHITQNSTYYELAQAIRLAKEQGADLPQIEAYQKKYSFSALAPRVIASYDS